MKNISPHSHHNFSAPLAGIPATNDAEMLHNHMTAIRLPYIPTVSSRRQINPLATTKSGTFYDVNSTSFPKSYDFISAYFMILIRLVTAS